MKLSSKIIIFSSVAIIACFRYMHTWWNVWASVYIVRRLWTLNTNSSKKTSIEVCEPQTGIGTSAGSSHRQLRSIESFARSATQHTGLDRTHNVPHYTSYHIASKNCIETGLITTFLYRRIYEEQSICKYCEVSSQSLYVLAHNNYAKLRRCTKILHNNRRPPRVSKAATNINLPQLDD